MDADTIVYEAEDGLITFRYPMLTVTETPVVAGRGDFSVAVRKIYAIRALVMATVYEDLDEVIEYMHQVLSAPKGTLTIKYNGLATGMLTITPEKDLRGGPRPRALSIMKIYGSKSALVEWEIETLVFPTPSGYTGEEGKWVDLVYTINTTVDRNFFAVREISGVLTLNRNFSVGDNISVDSFRLTLSEYFKIPPSTHGFWQREGQTFKTSPDNTFLSFTFIDKQTYAWLPYGVTSGDLEVSTTSVNDEDKGIVGTLMVNGYFQSTDRAPRQFVHAAVLDLLNLFFRTVVLEIKSVMSTTGQVFWVHEDRQAFTHHWRSNRVDFSVSWRIRGQYAGGLTQNITYTTGLVLEWLAKITRETYSVGPPVDEGPYGTSWSTGRLGEDNIESPIIINFAEKMEKGRTIGFPGGYQAKKPTEIRQGEESPEKTGHEKPAVLSFHQRFDYKLDMGMAHFPVLTEDYNDIIQQVRTPQLFLIVTGEIESPDNPPSAPIPPVELVSASFTGGESGIGSGKPRAVLLSASIKPQEPTSFGKYKLHWQYVLKLYNVAIPANLENGIVLRWPWSPNYEYDWEGDSKHKYRTFVLPEAM